MSELTCNMDADGDYDWYYDQPDDFTALDTKRSRKCCGSFAITQYGMTSKNEYMATRFQWQAGICASHAVIWR